MGEASWFWGFQFTNVNPVLRTHEKPHGISKDPGKGNHLTPSATKQQKREWPETPQPLTGHQFSQAALLFPIS